MIPSTTNDTTAEPVQNSSVASALSVEKESGAPALSDQRPATRATVHPTPSPTDDDPEAIFVDTWSEDMVGRGLLRSEARKCAADIWEFLEKNDRRVEAFNECLRLAGPPPGASPFGGDGPDFDGQACAYAERKGRGAERLHDECPREGVPENAKNGRLCQITAEDLIGQLEEIANEKSTHASRLNLVQSFFAFLVVRRWPSVAGFSATDMQKFTQSTPAQFLKKMRAWADFTGLPIPRARPQHVKAKISASMFEKNAHPCELRVYRDAA
jgi:hypothetical protein